MRSAAIAPRIHPRCQQKGTIKCISHHGYEDFCKEMGASANFATQPARFADSLGTFD
jgi:hypothetical protein